MRKLKLIICLICISIASPAAVIAADTETMGNFSVHAVIPDNQIDQKQTYFDLRVTPGSEQDLQVVITNSRSEELTVDVNLCDAATGRNGLIVYTESVPDLSGGEFSVTDAVTPHKQSVSVPPNGTGVAVFKVKMPEQSFDGVILGGISITENKPDGEETEPGGVSLKNIVTYVIALKLTESDNETQPDFTLGEITPGLINYKTAVVVTLHNQAARIVKGMDVSAQVFKKGSDTVLRELELSKSEMAPESGGEFVIDWGNRKLERGDYRLKMTVNYAGKVWEWDEDFNISGEADDLNRGAVGLDKDNAWIWRAAGITAVITVMLALWFIAYGLGKRRKKEK